MSRTMSRPIVLLILVGAVALVAFWLLLQTPGSLNEALAHPFAALAGTGHELNTRLIEASEFGDVVGAAGRRLLQPFGAITLVRIYDAREPDAAHRKPK